MYHVSVIRYRWCNQSVMLQIGCTICKRVLNRIMPPGFSYRFSHDIRCMATNVLAFGLLPRAQGHFHYCFRTRVCQEAWVICMANPEVGHYLQSGSRAKVSMVNCKTLIGCYCRTGKVDKGILLLICSKLLWLNIAVLQVPTNSIWYGIKFIKFLEYGFIGFGIYAVSYTHLTLTTKRIV